MPRPQILKHIPENADLFAGISGIIAGLFITSLYLVSPTIHLFMLGGSLALFSLAYLVVKKRPRGTESRMSMPGKIILEIVFFALYVASLLLVFTRDDRPLAYFVLIALCAGCTALSISKVTTKPETLLQILKIFLLSFNVKSLPIFSVGSGIDYWTHLAMNDSLSAGGFISALAGKEQFFPVMHIQTAVMQVIADVPVKEASFLAISLPLIISSVCVFLVARSLFSVQAGLIAMLIVNMTDYLTYWGYATQTTTFGICLFYFLMLVVFHRAQTKRDKTIWSTIFIILSVALVLGHAVSSFIFLVALSGLFAGSCMYKAMYGRHAEIFPSVLVLSLYGIILFEQWFVALYSQIGGNSFFGVIVSTLDYYVTENAALLNRPEAIASYAVTLPPFLERAANTTGLSLLIGLAVLGSLVWLGKKYHNRYTFSILSSTILLLVITFIFPLFGIHNIVPTRWFAFLYFFLSILAACGIFFLISRISRPQSRQVVLLVLIAGLTFFMTTSTISNLDSPLWLKASTIETGYSFQEKAGAETLGQYSGNLVSDSKYGVAIISLSLKHNVRYLELRNISDYSGKVIIWRDYLTDRPIQTNVVIPGYYKRVLDTVVLGPAFENDLKQNQKIYENDDVQGYYIRPASG